MANASDYLEQAIYNHIFRNATFAKPNPAIGLTLNVPVDSGAYVEVTGAGYARYATVSGDAFWSAMTAPGSGQNAVDFAFAIATGDWGTVSGVIICDGATVGQGNSNVLLHGQLTTAKNVQSGDTFKFSSSDLKISVS